MVPEPAAYDGHRPESKKSNNNSAKSLTGAKFYNKLAALSVYRLKN